MIKLRSKLRSLAACAIALLTLTPVRGADSPDVLADFRQAAIRQGWLLTKLNNSRATVLLVGTGLEQNLRLRPEYSVYQFASSASGRCLTFSVDKKIGSWNDLLKGTVFTIGPDGAIRPSKGHFATVKGIAVSADCQSLAVDGLYQEIDPVKQEISSGRAGLFLIHVGSSGVVRPIAEASTSQDYFGASDAAFGASWSPNSTLIAFSEDGAIRTFNVVSGEKKFLVAGTNPAWSPDGKWLGYRGPDGAPMLIDLTSRKTEPLVKGGSCLWSLKWSPDSRFAIFTQYGDRGGTVFRVCRLRDRAVASIYQSGAQYTEARFAWVARSTLAALLAPGELVRR